MRLTPSPNPAVTYHTNHPERGGAGKPEVDFSTRTPMCVCVWDGGVSYLATLRNKTIQKKNPIERKPLNKMKKKKCIKKFL